jgi:hypothetical protein
VRITEVGPLSFVFGFGNVVPSILANFSLKASSPPLLFTSSSVNPAAASAFLLRRAARRLARRCCLRRLMTILLLVVLLLEAYNMIPATIMSARMTLMATMRGVL